MFLVSIFSMLYLLPCCNFQACIYPFLPQLIPQVHSASWHDKDGAAEGGAGTVPLYPLGQKKLWCLHRPPSSWQRLCLFPLYVLNLWSVARHKVGLQED